MKRELLRVGTIYIPATNVELSSDWYINKLDAKLSYRDEDKAILNLANQSIFLVKSQENQSSNFYDMYGEERFSLTFEVDGLNALISIHKEFIEKAIKVGEIENRGHAGRNFVFYDLDGNKFDVWSELSPIFLEKNSINRREQMSRVIGFELSSQDPKKAVEFYSKVFGWEFAGNQWDYWSVMTEESFNPGINGGVSKGPNDFPHGTRIQIEVDSIDEVVGDAIGNGAMVVREKMEFDAFYLAYLVDPTGIGFGLIQKK